MSLRAMLSVAIFRHPKIRVCAIQAFVAGLCGFAALLGAIAFLNSPEWVLIVGSTPLVLWSFARSFQNELDEIRTEMDHLWRDLARLYLEIFLVVGAYAFGALVLLAIGLTINTGASLVQTHRLLNDIGGAHMMLVLFGIIGGASAIAGGTIGFFTGTLFRK